MIPHSRVIAVIDDDEAVCESTRFLLETHDFEVSTYLSGSEFLRDDPAVACVIVDYQMPSLTGFRIRRPTRNERKPRADHHDHSDD